MTIHGVWTGEKPCRPIVEATFIGPFGARRGALPFIVDTAADRTFIVPEHQGLIGIRDSELQGPTEPVETIAGPVRFMFLQSCTLVFMGVDDRPHVIPNLHIYFAGRRYRGLIARIFRHPSTQRSVIGMGQDYSVLGRDVLQRLAMGFCNPSDILFLTEKNAAYRDALREQFPKPAREPVWRDGLRIVHDPPLRQ